MLIIADTGTRRPQRVAGALLLATALVALASPAAAAQPGLRTYETP